MTRDYLQAAQALARLSKGDEVADRYEIDTLLAHTNMSVVHKAWDYKLDRGPVVLKFITHPKPHVANEEMKNALAIQFDLPEQFRAKWLGDGDVYIYDGSILSKEQAATEDKAQTIPYQVMEYLEGQTIKEWLAKGNITPDEAVQAMLDILSIIETLHKLDWIHRDIKPSNFIRDPNGTIRIIDFGVSKRLSDIGKTKVMSQGYTAPEVLYRESPQWSFRSDLYSAAAVFMALLCGEEVSHENGPVVDKEMAIEKVGPRLATLICKNLDSQPENRHESAKEMRIDFEEAAQAYRGWRKDVQKSQDLVQEAREIIRRLKQALQDELQVDELTGLMNQAARLRRELNQVNDAVEQWYADSAVSTSNVQVVEQRRSFLLDTTVKLKELIELANKELADHVVQGSSEKIKGMAVMDVDSVNTITEIENYPSDIEGWRVLADSILQSEGSGDKAISKEWRSQLVKDLQSHLRAILNRPFRPALEKSSELAKNVAGRREELDALRIDLERIKNLQNGQLDETGEDLSVRLVTSERRLNNLAYLHTVKTEIEKLWQAGQRLEDTDTRAAIGFYGDARNKADTALRSEQYSWSMAEETELRNLRAKASGKYDELRQRHEIPITREEEDIFYAVVEFAKQVERNSNELVTYFRDSSETTRLDESADDANYFEVTAVMPAGEALDIARDRLILFWERKVGEYLQSAREKLAQYQPREAESALAQCSKLPGRNDERVGKDIPQNLQIQIDNLAREIQKDKRDLERAERSVQQARLAADPVEQYRLYQDAKEAFPHLEQLDDLYQQIVKSVRLEVNEDLQEVEAKLSAEDWPGAGSRLKRVGQLLEIINDRELKNKFEDRYTRLNMVYEDVRQWALPPARQPQAEEARRLLEELSKQYADSYWPGWVKLQERLQELSARQDVDGLLAQIKETCNEKGRVDRWRLEDLLADSRQFLDNPPAGLSDDSRRQLKEAQQKIEAWIGFAQARDEIRKIESAKKQDVEALDLADPPNIDLIKTGLEQANKDGQTRQQVRISELDLLYNRLLKNDGAANEVVENTRQLLNRSDKPPLKELRRSYELVNKWLRSGTSHWRALRELRRELFVELAQAVRQKVEQMILGASDDFYATLDKAMRQEIQQLVKEYNKLLAEHEHTDKDTNASAGLPQSLDNLVAVPLAMAKAHQAEEDAKKELGEWETALTLWEQARDLDAQTDKRLREYCHRHARYAHKERQLLKIRHQTDRDHVEGVLRSLTEDRVLSGDWEVWFKHGMYALETGQFLLKPDAKLTVADTPRVYMTRARTSLNNALTEIQRQEASPETATHIQKTSGLLTELDEWDELVSVREDITELLDNEFLTANLCEKATQHYQDAKKELQIKTIGRILEQFWRTLCKEARIKLEKQLDEAVEVFARLDALLALLILFPEDEDLGMRLRVLVEEDVLNKMEHTVADIVLDYTAAKFIERYQQKHNQAPEAKEVVQLQLDEVDATLRTLGDLKVALKLKQLASLEISPDVLIGQERKVSDWRKELNDLKSSLTSAWSLAQTGMRQPEQFQKAHYILRDPRGQGASVHMTRVPENFRHSGHPSYQWHSGQIEVLLKIQEKQTQLKSDLEDLFEQEKQRTRWINQTKEGHALSDAETEAIQKLPDILENIKRKLQEMQNHAPDDPTRLQSELQYEAFDKFNWLYTSLGDIREIIKQKIKQYKLLKRWLNQFHIGQGNRPGAHYIIVDWNVEREDIAAIRDRDLQGLGEARNLCRRLREGDEEGYYQAGVLALTTGRTTLSEEAMLTYLEEKTGERTLYAVSELVNRERGEKELGLLEAIEECRSFETDIKRRLQQFNDQWKKFLAAQQALLIKRKPLLNEWEQLREYNLFIEAAQDFCEICPNHPPFLQAVAKIKEKTGLGFECDE